MNTRVMLSTALPFPAPTVAEVPSSPAAPDFADMLQQSYRRDDRANLAPSSALQEPQSQDRGDDARPQAERSQPPRDAAPRMDQQSDSGSKTPDPAVTAESTSDPANNTPAKPQETKKQQDPNKDTAAKDVSTKGVPAQPASNLQPQPPILLAMAAMLTQVPGQVGAAAQGVATKVQASLAPTTGQPVVAVAQSGVVNQSAAAVAAMAAKVLPQAQSQSQAQAQSQVQPLLKVQAPAQVPTPAVAGAAMVGAATPSVAPVKSPTFQDLVRLVHGGVHAADTASPATPGMQPTVDPSTATLLVTGGSNAANVLVSGQSEVAAQPQLELRGIDPANVTAQVAKSLQVNLTQGGSEVRMKLQPEHLGDVVLKLVVNGQNVQAHAVVSSQGVQQALEGQLAQLRRQLADTGLNLTGFSVSVGAQGDSAGQAFQDPRQGRQESGAWSTPDRTGQAQPSAAPRGGSSATRWTRLDTRA